MIRYNLKCDDAHVFESWFQSAEAFDKLKSAGMITCSVCGSKKVSKSIMAPAVATSVKAAEPAAKDLSALRKKIEATSDYVGDKFVKEARDMHDGVIPERPIYGEAKLQDAKKLVNDGVPVVPLPFIPKKKTS